MEIPDGSRLKINEVTRAAGGVASIRHVRDEAPTEEELLHWLGEAEAGRFHVLCRAGLVRVEDGRGVLAPECRRGSDCVIWHGWGDSISWNLITGEVQLGRSAAHRHF